MQIAMGTSLAAVVFNTFSSSVTHYRAKNILVTPLKNLLLSCGIGAFLGSFLAGIFPSIALQYLFGFFEITIGCIFFFQKHIEIEEDHRLPKGIHLFIIGFSVGLLSSILGIGGGVLMIPLLLYFCVPLKKAIGMTSCTSFITAVTASIAYMVVGKSSVQEPYSIGYVYLPAFLIIGVAGMISAQIGAKLTQVIPAKHLKKYFGLLVSAIGIFMLIK